MSRTLRGSNITIDHAFIRRWAEERGGRPVAVRGTSRGDADPGMIRIDFPGYAGEGRLDEITWDEWFRKFDASNLALTYQECTRDGAKSNFNKLVSRDRLRERDERYQGGSD